MSSEAATQQSGHNVETSMRLDVFNAKIAARENMEREGQRLGPEEQRLVDKMILDGTRSGFALPEDKRAELQTLQKELSTARQEFLVRVYMTFICVGT